MIKPDIRHHIWILWKHHLSSDPHFPLNLDSDSLDVLLERVVAPLADAMDSPSWDLCSPTFRDLVKTVSVLGGWLSENQYSVTSTLMIFRYLEKTLKEILGDTSMDELSDLTWGLASAALEAFHITKRQQNQESHAAFLRKVTPLFYIRQDVPVLLLLGSPGPDTVCELMERLHVTAIRRNAPHLFVDFAGVEETNVALARELVALKNKKRMGEKEIHIVSPTGEVDRQLEQEGVDPVTFPRHESLEEALASLSESEPRLA